MISFCRSLPRLALAGDLRLRPAHAAAGVHVFHAGDAALPPVEGQEARGGAGAALPAGPGRPHRMGVQQNRERLRRAGGGVACGTQNTCLNVVNENMNTVWVYRMLITGLLSANGCFLSGIQLPDVGPEGPRGLQALGDRHHADDLPADVRDQRHHVLR